MAVNWRLIGEGARLHLLRESGKLVKVYGAVAVAVVLVQRGDASVGGAVDAKLRRGRYMPLHAVRWPLRDCCMPSCGAAGRR